MGVPETFFGGTTVLERYLWDFGAPGAILGSLSCILGSLWAIFGLLKPIFGVHGKDFWAPGGILMHLMALFSCQKDFGVPEAHF